jgi:hypothetical protein
VLRNEDYGRIARLLATNVPVNVEFNIQNKTFPEGKTSHNAVAEIVGTDKADEVGDARRPFSIRGTRPPGATDNAIGCAIMMEAVRILQTVGAKPRRTIRVALWGGEEEGLLGSKAYVEQHFGTAEAPKPEWHKLSAYWNIDTGTGQVRGAGVFGPPAAGQVLREIFKPFEDFKVYGATITNSPRHRRHRQHLVQCRGPARHRRRPGRHRVQLAHPSHQPRHLRAHPSGRRDEECGRHRLARLSPGDARRVAAPLHQRDDAGAAERRAAAVVVVAHADARHRHRRFVMCELQFAISICWFCDWLFEEMRHA